MGGPLCVVLSRLGLGVSCSIFFFGCVGAVVGSACPGAVYSWFWAVVYRVEGDAMFGLVWVVVCLFWGVCVSWCS